MKVLKIGGAFHGTSEDLQPGQSGVWADLEGGGLQVYRTTFVTVDDTEGNAHELVFLIADGLDEHVARGLIRAEIADAGGLS